MSYDVEVFDQAGLYFRGGYASFDEALAAAIQFREKYGNRKMVRLYNAELVDSLDNGQWFDGLTEAEREALREDGVL